MVKKNTNKLKKILIILSIFIAAAVLIYIVKKLLSSKVIVDKNLCSPSNLIGKCDKGNYCESPGVCKKCPGINDKIMTNTDFNIVICRKVDDDLKCFEAGDPRAEFVKKDGTAGVVGEAAKFRFLEWDRLDDKTPREIITTGDKASSYFLVNTGTGGERLFTGSTCKDQCEQTTKCCTYTCNKGNTTFNAKIPTNLKQTKGADGCKTECKCDVSQQIHFYKTDMKSRVDSPNWNINISLLQPECQVCKFDPGYKCEGSGCAVELGDSTYFRLVKPVCTETKQCGGGEVCIDRRCKFIGC
jgi:hypothetical protein